MSTATQVENKNTMLRWTIVIAIAMAAFFASYRFAVASTAAKSAAGVPGSKVVSAAGGGCNMGGSAKSNGAPAGGGGCCGGGAKGPASTKGATVSGEVQKIDVDVSKGYYDPSTIELKAGVPAEITFSQSGGCTGQVQSQDLGFAEDLSSGPKTVKLPALAAGTYSFACGMNMVTGTIVVK